MTHLLQNCFDLKYIYIPDDSQSLAIATIRLETDYWHHIMLHFGGLNVCPITILILQQKCHVSHSTFFLIVFKDYIFMKIPGKLLWVRQVRC